MGFEFILIVLIKTALYCVVHRLMIEWIKVMRIDPKNNHIAVTYALDTFIYMMMLIHTFSVQCYELPFGNVNTDPGISIIHDNLSSVTATMIGPLVLNFRMKEAHLLTPVVDMPGTIVCHHVLASAYIMFFATTNMTEETILTHYYVTFVMAWDVFEFLGMFYYRAGVRSTFLSHYMKYVQYFDLIVKAYGNLTILYIIWLRYDHLKQYTSTYMSIILILSMFKIQINANYAIGRTAVAFSAVS